VGHRALPDFFARFGEAFRLEMQAFVAACRGEHAAPLTLNDATEATRIGQAITQSLRSGLPVTL
jgi:myo-inositol 2-dehydrogenase/D-chiro-inositol 1-dehydrogenase